MKELVDFSEALKLVKQGKRIARNGWNGKGMFVVYQKGYPNGIPSNKQTAEAWGLNEGDLFKVEPYLQIKMANGSHAMWVPSINDVLAEDWHVVEFELEEYENELETNRKLNMLIAKLEHENYFVVNHNQTFDRLTRMQQKAIARKLLEMETAK